MCACVCVGRGGGGHKSLWLNYISGFGTANSIALITVK